MTGRDSRRRRRRRRPTLTGLLTSKITTAAAAARGIRGAAAAEEGQQWGETLDGTRDASHTQTARGKIHPLVGDKEERFNFLFFQQRVLLPRVTHLELVVQASDELLGFVGHVNPTVK